MNFELVEMNHLNCTDRSKINDLVQHGRRQAVNLFHFNACNLIGE